MGEGGLQPCSPPLNPSRSTTPDPVLLGSLIHNPQRGSALDPFMFDNYIVVGGSAQVPDMLDIFFVGRAAPRTPLCLRFFCRGAPTPQCSAEDLSLNLCFSGSTSDPIMFEKFILVGSSNPKAAPGLQPGARYFRKKNWWAPPPPKPLARVLHQTPSFRWHYPLAPALVPHDPGFLEYFFSGEWGRPWLCILSVQGRSLPSPHRDPSWTTLCLIIYYGWDLRP